MIAKSVVTLDVKPWEAETGMQMRISFLYLMKNIILIFIDLAKMEELVRGVSMDGLEWKACKLFYFFFLIINLAKLVAIGYGVRKLQIMAHIEDEKVSVDDIQEKIAEFEEYVQSTDVVNFSKL